MPAILLLLSLLFIHSPAQPSAVLTDTRDGKSYRTVKIGEQVWMAENLNYNAENSRCYDNDPANCEKYGRLYDWNMAMKACPKGWHLPSEEDWETLVNYVEKDKHCSKCATKYLKAKNDWENKGNGVDSYGFAALPSGVTHNDDVVSIGSHGVWWSSTSRGVHYVSVLSMHSKSKYVSWFGFDKTSLFSVRCVRD